MESIDAGIVSTSLEEPTIDGPLPVAPAAPETPAAVPVAAAEDADPDGTIAGAGGVKFVPLGAVTAERGKRKDAEKALSEKDAKIAELAEKAQKYDETRAYLEQAKPYIETLRQRGLDAIKAPAPAPEAAGPLSPHEAEEYAKDFDLYTADGKPDLARAQRIAARNEKLADRKAQQAIAPILQTEAKRQSIALYQHYLSQPEVNGIKVDPKLLAEAWNTVPEENSADPRVAQVLFMNTIGRQILSGHKPIAAPSPVVPTEAPGGARGADTPLNDISQRFRQSAGIAPKEYAERREAFKPGQNNSLE